jgi:hypothetical protein
MFLLAYKSNSGLYCFHFLLFWFHLLKFYGSELELVQGYKHFFLVYVRNGFRKKLKRITDCNDFNSNCPV